jgi:hypothetical protein
MVHGPVGTFRVKIGGGDSAPTIYFSITSSQKIFFHPSSSLKNMLDGR